MKSDISCFVSLRHFVMLDVYKYEMTNIGTRIDTSANLSELKICHGVLRFKPLNFVTCLFRQRNQTKNYLRLTWCCIWLSDFTCIRVTIDFLMCLMSAPSLGTRHLVFFPRHDGIKSMTSGGNSPTYSYSADFKRQKTSISNSILLF